jgi:hypothetical protein
LSNIEIFRNIKQLSEKLWAEKELNNNVYGFQIQKGTRWNKGLDNNDIFEFERALGISFPEIYKDYLRVMNGTDKDTINIYGNSGYSYAYGEGFYSYPKDIEVMKERIKWILDSFRISENEMKSKEIPNIIPIVSHRFLLVDKTNINPILSMYGSDVILYSNSLSNFLELEIFNKKSVISYDINIPFWLEE